MLENKAINVFNEFFGRSSIEGAYARVDESDSWFNTINTVYDSLAKIKSFQHEQKQITAKDGTKLVAFYYPLENSTKTAIFVHGYKSHAERESAFPALFYRSLGYNVLVPYSRAHGLSEGDFITFGAKEVDDLCLWANEINSLHPNGELVLHGFSMGGAISLFCSDKGIKNLKLIVSDAPCISTIGVINEVANAVDVQNSKQLSEQLERLFKERFKVDALSLQAEKMVCKSSCPLLLTAGSQEGLEDDLKIVANACNMPTKTVILDGCMHGNGMYLQTQVYQNAIKEMIKKY